MNAVQLLRDGQIQLTLAPLLISSSWYVLCSTIDFKLRSYNFFFQTKQRQLINEIKPTFYCFNNVISLTYVFYLILHLRLVYKFLYLYHILS